MGKACNRRMQTLDICETDRRGGRLENHGARGAMSTKSGSTCGRNPSGPNTGERSWREPMNAVAFYEYMYSSERVNEAVMGQWNEEVSSQLHTTGYDGRDRGNLEERGPARKRRARELVSEFDCLVARSTERRTESQRAHLRIDERESTCDWERAARNEERGRQGFKQRRQSGTY